MAVVPENSSAAHGRVAERPVVRVLMDRCAGCQECVIRCPVSALDLDPATWTVFAHQELCVGCRQCVRSCPFSAIEVDGPVMDGERVVAPVAISSGSTEEILSSTKEVRLGLESWEEVLQEASRCLRCPDPTCVRGCPAHNDIPLFIERLLERDLDGAREALAPTSSMPEICARVCDQAVQCEGACSWSLAGGTPVAIGLLERFVGDHAPVLPIAFPPQAGAAAPEPSRASAPAPVSPGSEGKDTYGNEPTPAPLEVAVVGSGPASIAATAQLLRAGARVEVFEAAHEPGGLLTWGIPSFTLPDEIAERPWGALVAAGANLHCDTSVDAESLERLLDSHDAVILATGAGLPIRPPVPGIDLEGVLDATTFLQEGRRVLKSGGRLADLLVSPSALHTPGAGEERQVAFGQGGSPGGTPPVVLVLGGGNTAMDVARTARRLGADAICVDWMDRRFAPVRPDELEEAEIEGVQVRFNTTLVSLGGDGSKVRRALLAKTVQHSRDERPKILESDTYSLQVDMVVMAMGYRIEEAMAKIAKEVPVRKSFSGLPDRRWIASGIFGNPAPVGARGLPVGSMSYGREMARLVAMIPRTERLWVVGDALVGPSTVVEAMAQGRDAAWSILERRPSRKGTYEPRRPRVLVAVASKGGKTMRAARTLASEMSDRGAVARVMLFDQVRLEDLALADALIVGTWVEGLVVAKVGPARGVLDWIASLPLLGRIPVGLFCTYAFSPGKTLEMMERAIQDRNGDVRAKEAFLSRGGSGANLVGIANLAGILNPIGSHPEMAAAG
jgi:glutamate synthase (NADPH/NADH) small chain